MRFNTYCNLLIFIFILHSSTKGEIILNKYGLTAPESGDVALQFFADVSNSGPRSLAARLKMVKCCLRIDQDYDCNVMKLVSGLGVVLHPNETEQLRMYFVNRNIFDRNGDCELKILSWPAENQETAELPPTSGQKSAIKFKVEFQTQRLPLDLWKSTLALFGKAKKDHTKCSNVNQDPFNQCVADNCMLSYRGYRSFYNGQKNKCEPTPDCSGSTKMISPITNKCREVYNVEAVMDSLTEEMTSFEDSDLLEAHERTEVREASPRNLAELKIDEEVPLLFILGMSLKCGNGVRNGTTCICDPGWTSAPFDPDSYEHGVTTSYEMCDMRTSEGRVKQKAKNLNISSYILGALLILLIIALCVILPMWWKRCKKYKKDKYKPVETAECSTTDILADVRSRREPHSRYEPKSEPPSKQSSAISKKPSSSRQLSQKPSSSRQLSQKPSKVATAQPSATATRTISQKTLSAKPSKVSDKSRPNESVSRSTSHSSKNPFSKLYSELRKLETAHLLHQEDKDDEEIILYEKQAKKTNSQRNSLECLWYNRDIRQSVTDNKKIHPQSSNTQPYWRTSNQTMTKDSPAVINIENPVEIKPHESTATLEENKRQWREFINSFSANNNKYNANSSVLRQQSEPIFRTNRDMFASNEDLKNCNKTDFKSRISSQETLPSKSKLVDQLLAIDEYESGKGMKVLEPETTKYDHKVAHGRPLRDKSEVDMLALVPSEHSRSRTSILSENSSSSCKDEKWNSNSREKLVNYNEKDMDQMSSSTYEICNTDEAARELANLPKCVSEEIFIHEAVSQEAKVVAPPHRQVTLAERIEQSAASLQATNNDFSQNLKNIQYSMENQSHVSASNEQNTKKDKKYTRTPPVALKTSTPTSSISSVLKQNADNTNVNEINVAVADSEEMLESDSLPSDIIIAKTWSAATVSASCSGAEYNTMMAEKNKFWVADFVKSIQGGNGGTHDSNPWQLKSEMKRALSGEKIDRASKLMSGIYKQQD